MYFLINLGIAVIYIIILLVKKTEINPVALIGILILSIFIPAPVLKLLFYEWLHGRNRSITHRVQKMYF